MTLTVEIDPARRTAAFREVSFLAAGDSCRVVLDGVRGADFGSLALLLYRDAASGSPVASCPSFSAVPNHPSLADGLLALDTAEMAAWFADAVPEESEESDDAALPRPSASAGPRLAARASLAERSVRADGWLVVLDRDRTWAACRVPVLLRPGAGGGGATDPTSIRALVEGLVSAALADKADKAPPSAAGHLASLDASGNLADSGATPASIKAAAVAEVVANAPGTMDTLKEIADILGSVQQSGTVLKRISDLESGKADSSSLAAVATSGSYADLSGKPTIPAAVTVDAALTTPGAAADAKAVGDALRSGFMEWEISGVPDGWRVDSCSYRRSNPNGWGVVLLSDDLSMLSILNADQTDEEATSLTFSSAPEFYQDLAATRRLVTPTKTSQLTNDGAPNGGGVQYATTAQVSEKTELVPEFSDWTYSPHYSDDIHVVWHNGGWYLQGFEEAGAPPFSTDPDAVSLAIGTPFGEAVATRSLVGYVLGGQTTKPLQPKTALDDAPTAGSVNPVKSGGVYTAFQAKADKAVPSAAGNLASFDSQGNLADSGAKASDFAAKDDLPYRLVEPAQDGFTEWTFSGSGYDPNSHSYFVEYTEEEGSWTYSLLIDDAEEDFLYSDSPNDLEADFLHSNITATRHPKYALLDRAGNRVVVTGDTTLTLPAAVAGYARDFLVRLEISGSTVPTITFAAPTGETLTYETDGDEFPVPDDAGDWLYSFTESCVAHKFAVALKKVNAVAQGGS